MTDSSTLHNFQTTLWLTQPPVQWLPALFPRG